MKYLVLLGDGMADYPLDELSGKTPLEFARTPNMDRIAGIGTLGLIDTIPRGYAPGSDVANLTLLGYDPRLCYSGRGPLEAASMGVVLEEGDVAFRCNLVTLSDSEDPVMKDFTAGHIGSEEARSIIESLQRRLDTASLSFYPGVGYRHLLVWKQGIHSMKTTPPHDITGLRTGAYLPKGDGAAEILSLMERSRGILHDHPVNRARREQGKRQANAIWPWGQGRKPRMTSFKQKYRLQGGMISAVDLLNGLGVSAGFRVIRVSGATGYIDTDYLGKARAALAAVRDLDLVFVHVEAPDEMGHEGNVEGKIRAIEDFDEKVVGTVLKGMDSIDSFRLLVLSDHPTPISLKTHVADPSPFAVLSSETLENEGRGLPFGESSARSRGRLVSPGHLLMDAFVGDWRKFVADSSKQGQGPLR
ncbi:MAG: cofactor-independent phosphoglycerate mutase [Deltaproteobacteria bacterium]|nr:cofactor-independent phosphoglycerate mutase [Deltaproteobacteria bacterium]